jgi:hypothetical protein
VTGPGLPDFSWYNVPKFGKNIPNDYKICQISVKVPNAHLKYQHLDFQAFQYFKNCLFWCTNIPSGNPGTDGFERKLTN